MSNFSAPTHSTAVIDFAARASRREAETLVPEYIAAEIGGEPTFLWDADAVLVNWADEEDDDMLRRYHEAKMRIRSASPGLGDKALRLRAVLAVLPPCPIVEEASPAT